MARDSIQSIQPSPGNVMQTKENSPILTKNNGFQVVDGYSALEWLKNIFKSRDFCNQIQNVKIQTKRYDKLYRVDRSCYLMLSQEAHILLPYHRFFKNIPIIYFNIIRFLYNLICFLSPSSLKTIFWEGFINFTRLPKEFIPNKD